MSKILFYIFFSLLYILFAFATFISSLPETTFDFSFNQKYSMGLISPQGWGFFTKNPREDQYFLYKLKHDTKELVTFRNTSSKNLWGVSKLSRRINLEFQRILGRVDESMWSKSIPLNSKIDIEKSNEFLFIDIGQYLIERREVIPWQYSRFRKNYEPLKKFVLVDLHE